MLTTQLHQQLRLNTPIVLVSGHFGFADQLPHIYGFPWTEIGAITLKGTTLEARSGNPEPRVCETPLGLINSVGLENPGVHHVVAEKIPKLPQPPQLPQLASGKRVPYIANIAGSSVQEYADIVRILNNSAIDAIEVNISCPNIKDGGKLFGHDSVISKEVVSACREQTNKPLIVKLSPNQTAIENIAESCIEGGADILSAINTLSGMMIDIETRKPMLGGKTGGVSGSAIFPIALLKVHQVYQVAKQYNVPIIGQGGISHPDQAIAMIIAGATAIGIGSAMSNNLKICHQINQAFTDYLKKQQLSDISQLVGSLQDF